MPQTNNVVVFIHGFLTESAPVSHTALYNGFFTRLVTKQSSLSQDVAEIIRVEWGHQSPGGGTLRPDERLTPAQQHIHDLVSYEAVAGMPGPNNRLMIDWSFLFLLRNQIFGQVKEHTLLFGFADAAYYCSPDGEAAVRKAVYGQVLDQLQPLSQQPVTLHVIAHSLGCTVAFDFLYGLFAPDSNWSAGHPDFADDADYGEAYQDWRGQAQNGTLQLGSHTSMASQLPILLGRKQKVVDILATPGGRLDPSVIGIRPDAQTRWKIFYDIDDVLSYPTRNLFMKNDEIMDIQVDTGDLPAEAHDKYWQDDRVIQEVADLIVGTIA